MTLHNCGNCGTLNDKRVNGERCYKCGNEWQNPVTVFSGP